MMNTQTHSKILLVDDDPMLLNLFSTALTRDGCEVRTAVAGQAVLYPILYPILST